MTELKIDAGVQSGQRTRIKQKGMSVLRSTSRGDLYVELAVETPVNLTKRQKELLQEFTDEGQGHISPESESFHEQQVKDALGRKELINLSRHYGRPCPKQ